MLYLEEDRVRPAVDRQSQGDCLMTQSFARPWSQKLETEWLIIRLESRSRALLGS